PAPAQLLQDLVSRDLRPALVVSRRVAVSGSARGRRGRPGARGVPPQPEHRDQAGSPLKLAGPSGEPGIRLAIDLGRSTTTMGYQVVAGRELLEGGLASPTGVDVVHHGLLLVGGQPAGEHEAELRAGGAVRVHGPARSSRSICSWIIFLTLLLAMKTAATCIPSRSAASAPESPSIAVSSNASQVRGATRVRTRVLAISTSSRSKASASRCSRSSRAATEWSRSSIPLSPGPAPGRRRSARKSLQACRVKSLSQARKRRLGS